MNKLTTFINGIIEYGNAEFIEATDKENVVLSTSIYFDAQGNLYVFGLEKTFDRPYFVNGKVNLEADLVAVNPIDPVYKSYDEIFARVAKSNIDSIASVIWTNDAEQNEISDTEKKIIFNMAELLLGISNHDIIRAVCTSLDYLGRIMVESVLDSQNLELTKNKNIESVASSEEAFLNRINTILELSKKLQDRNLSRDEYCEVYPEWNRLYEDRKFNKCPLQPESKENKGNLLTLN